MSQETEENFCELCSARGVKSRLVSYQINFNEAIWLCEVKTCQFPVGCKQLFPRFVVQRSSSEVANWKKKNKPKANKPKGPSAGGSQLPKTEQAVDFFVQWQNKDSLCWLHSILSVLVHNQTLRTLLKQSSALLQSLPGTLLDKYDLAQKQCLTSQESAGRTLTEAEELAWNYLAPKMKCLLGKDDSPVTALPLLLRENQTVSDHYSQEIRWEFCCSVCGYQQTTRAKKILVTFPNTSEDFSMPHGAFVRPCYKCAAPEQKTTLFYDRMPDCILLHFVEGLKSAAFSDTKFNGADGSMYSATQFIRYSRNPNHFTCWTKETRGSRWLEMDDLKPVTCYWKGTDSRVPPSEIHIGVWEKVQSQKDCSKNTTRVPGVNSTMLMDISNHDPGKTTAVFKRNHHVDNCISLSRADQCRVNLNDDETTQTFSKETTSAEPKALAKHSHSTADVHGQNVENSVLHLQRSSNHDQTAPSCEGSLTAFSNLSADILKQKSASTLSSSMSEETLGKFQTASPPWRGRSAHTCRKIGVEPQKQKGKKFAPYIPRKQRPATQSCPSSPLSSEPVEISGEEGLKELKWVDCEKKGEVAWPAGQKAWLHSEFCPHDKGVSDSASESGYSSNSSNPGSVSSSEALSPSSQPTNCGDPQLDCELAAKLEEMLPECLLDKPSILPPLNLEKSLKKLSAEQDQFLLDLLAA